MKQIKTWYVSTAVDSKGNYILQTTEGRLVVNKEEIGDLDLSLPKSVEKLDKFVKSNIGSRVKDEETGLTTTFFGFSSSTREYATVESKIDKVKFVDSLSASALEVEYEETDEV